MTSGKNAALPAVDWNFLLDEAAIAEKNSVFRKFKV